MWSEHAIAGLQSRENINNIPNIPLESQNQSQILHIPHNIFTTEDVLQTFKTLPIDRTLLRRFEDLFVEDKNLQSLVFQKCTASIQQIKQKILKIIDIIDDSLQIDRENDEKKQFFRICTVLNGLCLCVDCGTPLIHAMICVECLHENELVSFCGNCLHSVNSGRHKHSTSSFLQVSSTEARLFFEHDPQRLITMTTSALKSKNSIEEKEVCVNMSGLRFHRGNFYQCEECSYHDVFKSVFCESCRDHCHEGHTTTLSKYKVAYCACSQVDCCYLQSMEDMTVCCEDCGDYVEGFVCRRNSELKYVTVRCLQCSYDILPYSSTFYPSVASLSKLPSRRAWIALSNCTNLEEQGLTSINSIVETENYHWGFFCSSHYCEQSLIRGTRFICSGCFEIGGVEVFLCWKCAMLHSTCCGLNNEMPQDLSEHEFDHSLLFVGKPCNVFPADYRSRIFEPLSLKRRVFRLHMRSMSAYDMCCLLAYIVSEKPFSQWFRAASFFAEILHVGRDLSFPEIVQHALETLTMEHGSPFGLPRYVFTTCRGMHKSPKREFIVRDEDIYVGEVTICLTCNKIEWNREKIKANSIIRWRHRNENWKELLEEITECTEKIIRSPDIRCSLLYVDL